MRLKYRHKIALAGIAISGAAIALAQDVSQSDLELCASQESAELKLACFEALATINAPPAMPPDSSAVQTGDATESAPEPQPVPETNDEVAGEAPEPAVPVAPAASIPAASAATKADDAAVTDQQRPNPADDLGSEHLRRTSDDEDEDSDRPVQVTVVNVSEGRYKVLYFTFSNGQRWRQIEGRRFRYPKDGEFDAIITRGMLGDYRLRLDEDSPMTRIRRIE